MRVTQPALKESQPEDTDKHPDTNDASLNLFLSTIQKHLNKQFPSYWIALVSSLSHTSFPELPSKANSRPISKALARDSKKHGHIGIYLRKVLSFLRGLWTDSLFPLLEESGTRIPRTGPGYKRSQRLFLKRSLRHVENICIAQQGLKSEPEASISLPCKFFKANKLKCGPDNVQSVFIPHTQQLDIEISTSLGCEMKQMSNSGLLWPPFIPPTRYTNTIWSKQNHWNRLYWFVLRTSDSATDTTDRLKRPVIQRFEKDAYLWNLPITQIIHSWQLQK